MYCIHEDVITEVNDHATIEKQQKNCKEFGGIGIPINQVMAYNAKCQIVHAFYQSIIVSMAEIVFIGMFISPRTRLADEKMVRSNRKGQQRPGFNPLGPRCWIHLLGNYNKPQRCPACQVSPKYKWTIFVKKEHRGFMRNRCVQQISFSQ